MKSTRSIPKTLLLALLLAIGAPGSAQAHDEAGGEQGARGKKHGHKLEMRVSRMQEKLNLSDTQADSVYEILKKAKSGKECKEERFSERKKCRLEKRAAVYTEIAAQLTPEQKEEFEKMKEKREKRRKDRSGRRHKGHRH